MSERGKGLSDEALGLLVDRKITDSVTWYSSKLSREREQVLKYYNSELPLKQNQGSSSFISTDVYDGVEAMKAQLLETFASGREIVKFDPTGPEDAEEARIATKYCDHVVFSQNDGYKLFGDVIHDGLIARVGVAKVFWEKNIKKVDEEFDGLPEEAVHLIASDESVDKLTAEQDLETGMFSGKLVRKKDLSQVKIEDINPEEFLIEPHAKNLGPDYVCGHRTMKTEDELLKMGYDLKKIRKAAKSEDAIALQSRPEVFARFQQIDSGFVQNDNEDESKHLYIVNEVYIKVRREGDSYAKLYKVVRLGDQTLEVEEVDDHPFVCYRPLPIPHSFFGNNYASRIIPTQNVNTVLTRAIVDHASITVNPRYSVLKGGLTNPRELLDNRLGGIVNVTRPDAVKPLEQASLNPFVFQALQLVDSKNEKTTGISSLSQGLNKDAVSSQNSDAMVERLVGLSQTRQKIVARNFANDFLLPLYLKVYDLVITKEDKKKIMDVAGNWVPVDPTRWKERRAATVSLHLGYKEHENEAQKLVQLGSLLNQDPRLQRMFTDDNRYKLAVDVMKLQGHGNYNDYITPPEKLPPEQPNPMEVAKAQVEKTKADAAMLTAQASMKKIDMHGAIEVSREKLQEQQKAFDNHIKELETHRKDIDIANKIDVSQREMKLAENAPMTKGTAVVSPR